MAVTTKILNAIVSRLTGFWVAAVASPWVTVISAGGMDDQDNSGSVTNPETEITDATRIRFKLDDQNATTLRFRLGYAGTPSTDPVITVWGRKLAAGETTGGWKRLYNKAASPAVTMTLTTATATDYNDGTLKHTNDNPLTHAVDVDGCDEFLVQVVTAYAVSAGSAATAILEVQRA